MLGLQREPASRYADCFALQKLTSTAGRAIMPAQHSAIVVEVVPLALALFLRDIWRGKEIRRKEKGLSRASSTPLQRSEHLQLHFIAGGAGWMRSTLAYIAHHVKRGPNGGSFRSGRVFGK